MRSRPRHRGGVRRGAARPPAGVRGRGRALPSLLHVRGRRRPGVAAAACAACACATARRPLSCTTMSLTKAPHKWFYLERNRAWALLSNLRVSTLLLLAPALAAAEMAVAIRAFREGWLEEKVTRLGFIVRARAAVCSRGAARFRLREMSLTFVFLEKFLGEIRTRIIDDRGADLGRSVYRGDTGRVLWLRLAVRTFGQREAAAGMAPGMAARCASRTRGAARPRRSSDRGRAAG